MAATRQDINRWFEQGLNEGATHMIVVCDTFDYEDYPVYVSPGSNAREVAAQLGSQSMQQVMEVYAMHLDKAAQLMEFRAFHYDDAPPTEVITEEPV